MSLFKRINDYGTIELEGMEFHAFHGCLPQEREEGNTFIVDFRAETDLSSAMKSDNIGDTVDYGEIYDVIASQMKIPSNLLEHLAGRIVQALQQRFKSLSYIMIRVSKKNPPVNGKCSWSRVRVSSGNRDNDLLNIF
ncbi:MAG: dihydroneopterin aldolase [Candidatus Cryptobacteroides sp.]